MAEPTESCNGLAESCLEDVSILVIKEDVLSRVPAIEIGERVAAQLKSYSANLSSHTATPSYSIRNDLVMMRTA